MPTIFSAKLDGSEAVRYAHVSLVAFYLRQCREKAVAAAALSPCEEQFAQSLLTVILAALCLEALANEAGENSLPSEELKDFLMSRRKHRMPDGLGSVAWKLMTVFERKWSHALARDCSLILEIEALFDVRNELVHYKLGDSAAKTYLPPPARIADEETGTVMTVIDFIQKPIRIEPPLVARVNAKVAARAYDTALSVIRLWNEKAGAPPGTLSAHTPL